MQTFLLNLNTTHIVADLQAMLRNQLKDDVVYVLKVRRVLLDWRVYPPSPSVTQDGLRWLIIDYV